MEIIGKKWQKIAQNQIFEENGQNLILWAKTLPEGQTTFFFQKQAWNIYYPIKRQPRAKFQENLALGSPDMEWRMHETDAHKDAKMHKRISVNPRASAEAEKLITGWMQSPYHTL